jgi:Flp pilus assembly protein TadD
MGMHDEAIAQFLVAIRLRPLDEKAHFNLGLSYLAKRQVAEARKEFETVLMMNPGNYQAAQFLGHLSSLK